MIKRSLQTHLLRLARQYPVVTVTGPRQSGKTTLVKAAFPKHAYVNLEDLDQRTMAEKDPRGFLSDNGPRLILDEIQRVPCLVSYIQGIVDDRQAPGQFILTGSQQFEVTDTVNQSLAGRTALLKLLPFSYRELYGRRRVAVDDVIHAGFYPRIHDRKLDPTEALGFYLETYVQRDIRQLINIRDLQAFDKFLKLCAAQTGQLVNYANLGNSCGIDLKTAKAWLGILEASYIVFMLQPYYRNLKKRIIKTPKLYFYDVGLAAYLLDIAKPGHVATHPLKGQLFENFVIAELLKQRFNTVRKNNLFFYRDHTGNEVDVVFEDGPELTALEIKAGATVAGDYIKGIGKFREAAGRECTGTVVYGGSRKVSYKGMRVVPYHAV